MLVLACLAVEDAHKACPSSLAIQSMNNLAFAMLLASFTIAEAKVIAFEPSVG